MPLVTDVKDVTLDLSPYALADRLDVHSPDNKESAGVRFLERVQDYANECDTDALLESIRDFVAKGNDPEEFTVNDLSDDLRDSMMEWADSCVQIYTYQVWQEFVDLCLYQEDVRDLSLPEEGDLTKIAMTAEYVVAERGLGVLLAERAIALFAANPEDSFPHDDADSIVLHLEEAKDADDLFVHLERGHGIDLTTVAPGTDLDTLHRTLDHSDLPEDDDLGNHTIDAAGGHALDCEGC